MPTNREVVELYRKAVGAQDWRTVHSLLHEDYVGCYPQTGEVIRGRDNFEACYSRYPTELPGGELTEVTGGDEPVHVSTSSIGFGMPLITVMGGGGDAVTVAGKATYPDGSEYHVVAIIELQDQQIIKETLYWAAPEDPPEWRRPWVEVTSD